MQRLLLFATSVFCCFLLILLVTIFSHLLLILRWVNILNENKKSKLKKCFAGGIIGIINGMLGAGGGMLAVPVLKSLGLEQKKAQANAIAVILPITVLSATLYVMGGNVSLSDALPFIPGGLIGSILGTFIMSRISPKYLKIIFGGFMIWAGIRLLMR